MMYLHNDAMLSREASAMSLAWSGAEGWCTRARLSGGWVGSVIGSPSEDQICGGVDVCEGQAILIYIVMYMHHFWLVTFSRAGVHSRLIPYKKEGRQLRSQLRPKTLFCQQSKRRGFHDT